MFTTALGEAGDEPARRRDVTAFADHGFDDDRRDLLGHDLGLQEPVEAAQRPADLGLLVGHVWVGERRNEHAGRERPVPGAVDGARGRHRHREVGATVEGAVEHHDVVASRGVLGDLDGDLEHLVAAVRVEERVDRRRRDLVEFRSQRFEQVVGVHVLLCVDEPGGLVGDGLHDLGMAVAGGRRCDAGGEVEVLGAVHVDHPASVSADDVEVGGLGPDVRQVRNR